MAKINNWRKFSLLLWKNWIQHSKKQIVVLNLLAFVLIGFFSVMYVTLRFTESKFEPEMHYPELEISNLDLFFTNTQELPKSELLFSPNTSSIYDSIVKDAAASLKLTGYRGYATASDLQQALSKGNYLAGVQFDENALYPNKLAFALLFPSELRTDASTVLRKTWSTDTLYLSLKPGARNKDDVDGGIPVGYLREGFLPVQHAISMAYLKSAGKQNSLPEIVMQRYPYPTYLDVSGNLAEMAYKIITFIIIVIFMFHAVSIVKRITVEKEKQLKEVMKIHGLNNWLHWMAWFVKSFIVLAITGAVITIVIAMTWITNDLTVVKHSSFMAVYLFIHVYVITTICFSFMISAFCNTATTAALTTVISCSISYLPHLFLRYEYMALWHKLLWCLSVNTAMGLGFQVIFKLETAGEGLQWSNLFTPFFGNDDLTLGAIMLVMLFSCVIYILICLYVEEIRPSKFGVPKKCYFPCTKDFWCPTEHHATIVDIDEITHRNPDAFDTEPSDKYAGIQVRNLKKKFGKKVAVSDLSMNMYQDEITVLLGHNGAGKTTTISMLVGMLPSTSGTVFVNGYDMRKDMNYARGSLGICPQDSVLFDNMSAANHITFFSRLQGLKGYAVNREVDKYLQMMQLECALAHVPSSQLSGGMKRKLSVCCALCGGTKVVLFDEPSAGMDPLARRQLWNLLLAEKSGRTILLTTHLMDEADVLGDRIAIMCEGELNCYGTSFFLKKKYGSGYHLICVKLKGCNVNLVTSLLRQYIPDISPESDIGAELSYLLPDSHTSKFEKMFNSLESNFDNLKISGYGIGVTSLEEVFMKVGIKNSATTNGNALDQVNLESTYSDQINSENPRQNRDQIVYRNLFHAMFLKKFIYTKYHYIILLLQNLLPIIVLASVELIKSELHGSGLLPPLPIDLTRYPEAVIILEAKSLMPNSLESSIAEQYKSIATSFGEKYTFESTGSNNFTEYILNLGKTMQNRIDLCYLAAATVAPGKITAWLNNQPLHTAPLTVNLVHNAMARSLINPSAEVMVTNAPHLYKSISPLGNIQGSGIGPPIALSMCIVTSFYITFLIKERSSRSKLLQFVSGVNVWIFWLSHLIWDFATFTITTLFIIITLVILNHMLDHEIGPSFYVMLMLLIFGCSALTFTYLIAYYFVEPVNGLIFILFFNLFQCTVAPIIVLLMEIFGKSTDLLTWLYRAFPHYNLFSGISKWGVMTQARNECSNTLILNLPVEIRCTMKPECCCTVAPIIVLLMEIFGKSTDLLTWLYRAFPHYNLFSGISKWGVMTQARNECSNTLILNLPVEIRCTMKPECCSTPSYFDWKYPGALPEVVCMACSAMLFFLLVIIREYGIIKIMINKFFMGNQTPPPRSNADYVDDDVLREEERISAMSKDEIADQSIVLDKVSKYFGNVLAVSQISLCVEQKECFGLLGVNGAGKTTTFKMITGDENITLGTAYVMGLNLATDLNKIYNKIGYCPQFDGLFGDFTGRQTLKIFGLLRGIRKDRIKRLSEQLAQSLGFAEHLDKRCHAYSGGNKRKLSAAIALLGSPSIIFLDEPTAGLDPVARRKMWNVICHVRDMGKSIVLTSHNMDECEALCTRMVIMVNGEFKCIGSIQHLKNKFSKGLTLKIMIDNQASGREETMSILTYFIPLSSIEMPKLFGLIESNRTALNIVSYSISQTTLEAIFIEFAKTERHRTY